MTRLKLGERVFVVVLAVVMLGIVVFTFPKPAVAPPATSDNQNANESINQNRNLSGVDALFDRPAPDFSLFDLDGASVNSSSLAGAQAAILTFWRTDCASCLSQLEALATIAADAEKSAEILAINVGQSEAEVRKFVADGRLKVRVLLDPSDATSAYHHPSLPMTYFIHRGTIVGFGAGTLPVDALRTRISSISALP